MQKETVFTPDSNVERALDLYWGRSEELEERFFREATAKSTDEEPEKCSVEEALQRLMDEEPAEEVFLKETDVFNLG